MININYEEAIDFEHCLNIREAQQKLSQLTNLLNKIIMVRQSAKKDILLICSGIPESHKLSWDNKLVRISEDNAENCEIVEDYCDADTAYRQVKMKHSQVMEDLMALKKIQDIEPKH